MAKPVIFGCSGLKLTAEEREFFKKHQPYGFIIFKRNIENPAQVRALVEEFKSCVEHKFVPILIDQEGGRVARLRPPYWPEFECCGNFEKKESPLDASFTGGFNIAKELAAIGVNVDCAPMLDVRQPGAHDIVGDRAFSEDPKIVAKLGRAFMDGLKMGGVLPIIKHIPGHGRAMSDSHLELPRVKASLKELEVDFYPFRELNDAPYAMTAHIIYEAIDPDNCATQSAKVIKLIRENIGFKGLIMTDDLSMKALAGSFAERTKRSLDAGCDLILHCNGEMAEMKEIAEALKGHDMRKYAQSETIGAVR